MINYYTIDEQQIYTGVVQIDPYAPLPPGTTTPPPDTTGDEVAQWTGMDWVVLDSYPQAPSQPGPSQLDRDKARYEKRAAVKDELLAWMAADNMSRVRSGAWTVQNLTALLADPAVAAANQFMSTLSFELAAQAIASASTSLLTPAIRADWIARLQAHFYLEG